MPTTKLFEQEKRQTGKAYTFTIESMNNQLRCHLARLKRRTHSYSKSAANLRDSLLFVFQRRFGCALTAQTGLAVCKRIWQGRMYQYLFSNPQKGWEYRV